jgi:hypothetical protein
MVVPVTFTATGNQLKHAREASVAATQTNSRQWLTEAGGYAVFTPTDASPVLRVELYAAPKPVSSMHATDAGITPAAASGSFNLSLSGSSINTGASLGNGFDILGLVKAFELQYAASAFGVAAPPSASVDPNVIRNVGITSDYVNRAAGTGKAATRIMFGLEGFGDAATPDFNSSDKEVFIDTNAADIGVAFNPNFAIFLSNNGTGQENVYLPHFVNLATNSQGVRLFTNGFSAATADTNIYNNSAIVIPVLCTDVGLIGASGTGQTAFQYQVVTFDRSGNEVDETPVLYYDLANPGIETEAGGTEPFMFNDLAATTIPVNYNGTNFQTNGSLGVLLLHMHNGTGSRSDTVALRKPTITGFSPTSGKVGAQITITGSNFGPGTQVTFFNNMPAASVNVLTANTLVATVPAGATSGPIKVSNAAGSTSRPGFTVLP